MSSPTIRVAVAYHSGYGHTTMQAEAVARGAATVADTSVDLLDVSDVNDAVWETLERADAIIFGAPTYMGGPSGPFKTFADASSGAWLADRWLGKVAAGFTTSGHMGGDKLNTLIYFSILAAQHGMIWFSLGMKGGWYTSAGSPDDLNRLGGWLGAMAQANKDQAADLAPPQSDLDTAAALGSRVASVTHYLTRGRRETAASQAA
ncbi:MAG: flavodoxin family protein [Chloroflexota bacterium]|nr:flavodoxin family protein [Chloroflexota bacterium]